MSCPQYFQMELDDMAAPSFVSFGKYYFGTMEEIADFVCALEDKQLSPDLVAAFRAYKNGEYNIRHPVANRYVPLLKPARLLHEETRTLENFFWVHINVWDAPYALECNNVETRNVWLECGGIHFRALYARFTGLKVSGATALWRPVGHSLCGYPEMLHYEQPVLYNRLAEFERTFESSDDMEEDWRLFCERPHPDFTEFCNDIFGNG